jgi:uncharacterized protein YoxC
VIEIFAEYGTIGVVVILFSYMVMNIIKSLKSQDDDLDNLRQSMAQMASEITNVQGICIKLIDRWNKADDRADVRHEKVMEEVNDVTDQLNFLKGRINGSGGRA